MYFPSRDQFRAHAEEGYPRIPVVREILSDLETPVSAFLKLAAGPRSFLLESVEGGEKWGRYSILGLPAREWVTLRGGSFTRFVDGDRSLGRAADRLVLDEANRAGFHHCLVPSPGRTNALEGGSDPLELGYHVWGPSDTASNLAKWAAGNLLGRGATGLTSLLDAPSRIFRRFGHQSQRPTD